MNSESQRTPRTSVLLMLTLFVVLAVYVRALDGAFIWDDHPLIEQQPIVTSLHPMWEYFLHRFWSDPLSYEQRTFYRPLVTWSFAIDWSLGGGQPVLFHLTNVIAHLVNVTLLFFLMLRAGAVPLAAALAAALWGVLPRLTESVAWISGRTDVFAGTFVLAALLLWPTEERAWGRRVLAALALLLGLFSKEVALAGVAAVVAIEATRVRGDGLRIRRAALHVAPVLFAIVVYGGLRVLAPSHAPKMPYEREAPLVLVTFLEAVGRYVAMVLDPLRPRTQIGLGGVPDFAFVALGAASLLPAMWWMVRFVRSRPHPVNAAVAAIGVCAILPVLHLVPLAVNVIAADRFLYLPTAALALALALALGPDPKTLTMAAGVLSVAAFGASSYSRIGDWNREIPFWKHACATAKAENGYPFGVLGDVLLERGLPDAALGEYRTALERNELAWDRAFVQKRKPEVPAAQLNMALAFAKLGRYEESQALLDGLLVKHSTWRRLLYARVMLALRRLALDTARLELARIDSSLGSDDVTRRLASLIDDTRARLAAMPAGDTEQDAESLAKRALLFDGLGAIYEATRTWERVLSAPDASAALLRRAAGYIVVNATPAHAREAFSRLASRVPHDEEFARLESIVLEREQDAIDAG